LIASDPAFFMLSYNTEFSKVNICDMNLMRMNVTVIVGEDGVERVSFEPTKNLSCWISDQSTGISSLRYKQTASDQKTVISEGEERYYETNRQRTVIQISSAFRREENTSEDWKLGEIQFPTADS